MGNAGSSFLHRKPRVDTPHQLLDMECLNSIQFNDLYFALDKFKKDFPQAGAGEDGQPILALTDNDNAASVAGAGAIVPLDNSPPRKHYEGGVRYCQRCKDIIVKKLDFHALDYVRRIVLDIFNGGEAFDNNYNGELVTVTGGGLLSDDDLANDYINMQSFLNYFGAYIYRYKLIPDAVAVKWALIEYDKMSEEGKMDYVIIEPCECRHHRAMKEKNQFKLKNPAKPAALKAIKATKASKK